jgi:hypothetical protein
MNSLENIALRRRTLMNDCAKSLIAALWRLPEAGALTGSKSAQRDAETVTTRMIMHELHQSIKSYLGLECD